MPKGKKKGKGKGKGKKDKGAKAPPPPKVSTEPPFDDTSKEFYLIQIRDLEGRVSRYQAKCDKLLESNEDMEKQLQQQMEDQESIMTLLKKKIQEQSAQQLELEEAMTALREEKELELEKLQHEITAVREEAQDRLDQMLSENTVLRGTLDSLEEYRLNKASYDENLQKLQDTIKKQQKNFDEHIYQLDKQAVLDKDRSLSLLFSPSLFLPSSLTLRSLPPSPLLSLPPYISLFSITFVLFHYFLLLTHHIYCRLKKEMVGKVNLVAAEFRKMSDLQMADTTKRAIQENITINVQLQKMSEKTTELVKENERLATREKDLKRQLEIAESTEKEATCKNISNQKVENNYHNTKLVC